MMRPPFAYDAFRRHFDSADFHRKRGGFAMLELGPGDSLAAAVVARAHGASRTCHVDVGPFATRDLAVYRAAADYLAERGLSPPDLSAARSLEDVLAACDARYETRGLESLRALPDASFDFVFSNGVLQSVRREEFVDTMAEVRRVLHPQGVSVHSVDLRDTMGQSLHHLRFRESVWESRWFRSAGFYTNRLRFGAIIELCQGVGLEATPSEVNRWDHLPVPRKALAPAYRDLPEDELLTATVRVILRRRESAEAGGVEGGAGPRGKYEFEASG
jgi:SAM-dependent methyltransferase